MSADEKLLDFPTIERVAKAAKADPGTVRRPGVLTLARNVLDLLAHVKLLNSHWASERQGWAAELNTLMSSMRRADVDRRSAAHRLGLVMVAVNAADHDLKCASLIRGQCNCWKATVSKAFAESDRT